MKFLKHNIWFLIAAAILVVLFFSTRLYNITSLPIFTDEAIYTRWAQIAKNDSNWRFISLTDGKQPSFVWIDILYMKFIEDPLVAGRLVSVTAGFATAIGLFLLTNLVFSSEKRKGFYVGMTAAAIAVIFPFSLVYDRMAIYDSLVAAFFVWSLLFQILLVKKLRLDVAMVLGFVLGGAVLTKSSGFLSIYFSPILLFLLGFKKNQLLKKVIKFFLLFLISISIAYGMYSILRLSPFFHIITEKNSIFVISPSEWLSLPFNIKIDNFLSNTRGLVDWFIIYFTIPYIILAAASFFVEKHFLKEKLVLLLWFVLPFLSLCVFGRTLYPRYILFMVMPLIPLVSISVWNILARYKNILLRLLFIVLILVLPLRMMYYVLFDFAHAPIPKSDLEQYINGWPSGGGVAESVEFFKKESQKGPIYLATQGTFGLMPYAYEIYLVSNKNITIKGFWPTNDTVPDEVKDASTKMPTYFVFYQDCSLCKFPGEAPVSWPVKKVASFDKGKGSTKLTVYEVIPQ